MLPVILILSALVCLGVLYFFRGALSRNVSVPHPPVAASAFVHPALPDEGFASPAQGAVDDLAMEVDDLHWLLANKKADLQNLKTEQSVKGEIAMKVGAIEDTIDTVETRLRKLQAAIADVRQTAISLDELSVALRQSGEELLQSQQALQATQTANSELRQQLEELQDYAADLKEQRHQLQQQLRRLEDLHGTS